MMLKRLIKMVIFMILVMLFPLTIADLPAYQTFPDFKIESGLQKISEKDGVEDYILSVVFNINPGYYVYKEKLAIELPKTTSFKVIEKNYPEGDVKYDKFLGRNIEIYTGKQNFNLRLSVLKEKYFGNPVKFSITYQACSESICYMQRTVELEASLDDSGRNVFPISMGNTSRLQDLLSKGFLLALIASFLMGILSSLTPCVYPIIPIIMAVVGSRAAGSKLKGFKLSVYFLSGLALVYSSLGLLAARTGAIFGSFMQSDYAVLAVASVFFLMGLSLIGLYEFRLPYFISKKLPVAPDKNQGFTGSLLAGMLTGLVAVPCVGPFVVSILAYAAKTSVAAKGFALLFSFSLGMGLLFVVIGTFSALAASALPKSGKWLVISKKLFGLILISVAFYYSRSVLPFSEFRLVAGTILLITAFVFLKLDSLGWTFLKSLHRFLAILCIAGSLGLIIFPPILRGIKDGTVSNRSAAIGTRIEWIKSEREALKTAAAGHKPLIVDFYADWCPSCLDLEKYTFSNSKVVSRSKDFVMLRIDMTEDNEANAAIAEKYSILGLPTILFLNSDGTVMGSLRIVGYLDAPEFIEAMDKAIGKKG